MRTRKRLVVCFAALLAGIGLAIPTPAGAASIPATCGTQSGGSQAVYNPVHFVRVGHHTEEGGFDRFVVEFWNSSLPSWTATPKSSALFYTTGGKGPQPVQLEGTAGIKLSLFSTSLHDPMQPFTPPSRYDPEFPQLAEVRDLGDFEGHVDFGLSLERQSCKRILTLTSPTRLVIDVPN
jgi:hypothetical protein